MQLARVDLISKETLSLFDLKVTLPGCHITYVQGVTECWGYKKCYVALKGALTNGTISNAPSLNYSRVL